MNGVTRLRVLGLLSIDRFECCETGGIGLAHLPKLLLHLHEGSD